MNKNHYQATIAANRQLITRMAELIQEAELASREYCDGIGQDLLQEFNTGDEALNVEEVVCAFLPDNAICILTEDFNRENDHASLVEEFSLATNGSWAIENCSSKYDPNRERWLVTFTQNGSLKKWKFTQTSNRLSKKFLRQLITHTESESGYSVTLLNTNEVISLVCLPSGMYEKLTEQYSLALAA